MPKSNRQKTCSDKCRHERNAEVSRQWHHENKAEPKDTFSNTPFVLKEKRPPDIVCEFKHLRPGDPGFDELAKQITPLERIKNRAIPGKLLQMDGKFIPYY